MNAADLVKQAEGCDLRSYPDPASPLAKSIRVGRADYKLDGAPWTIGWGCTGKMHDGRVIAPGLTITQAEADAELERRLAYTEHVLTSMLERPATPNQLAAMVSLAYNIGLGAAPDKGFEHSTVRHAFNSGDFQHAADAFLLFNKSHGQVVPGLVNRRYAERRVFLGGEPHA